MNRADLIELVEADLPGHRLTNRLHGTATFVPESGGPMLKVSERVERRFLGRTWFARFEVNFPGQLWSDGRFKVRHTGRFRRSGIALVGGEDDFLLGNALESDHRFVAAVTALDFTLYEIEVRGASCSARVELMGASLVSIAFPPVRSYIRLHPDQRDALISSFEALGRLVSVSPAERRY